MSKLIGKAIYIPKNIEVYILFNYLLIKNKTKSVIIKMPKQTSLKKKGLFLFFKFTSTEYNFGTWYKLFKNIVFGMSRFYSIRLVLKGIGYKAFLHQSSNILEMKLGFSHLTEYKINKETELFIHKNNIITLNSPLKDILGSEANRIKNYRKPDNYKGKGIQYRGEYLKLKTGKKA